MVERSWRTAPKLLGLLAGALIFVAAGVSIAHACGMFRGIAVPSERRPSLSREKVVIVYDAEKKTEHFIREIAFSRADTSFGFVVPVPSKPTVAKLKDPELFTSLRGTFVYERRIGLVGGGIGSGSGYGRGSGAGFGGGGVKVEEVRRVGSFKAYILSATNEKDLAAWLKRNRFAASKGGEAWLKHYVALGFYYVAMRYDPPRGRSKRNKQADDGHPLDAETVRISFETPAPYYPYLEPVEPKLDEDSPRLLEVWYVGADPVLPICVKETDDKKQWVRPLRLGATYEDETKALREVSEALSTFLPEGDLVVQTFQDQKRRRDGFGDILFVPKDETKVSTERGLELASLLAVLDPGLAPSPTDDEEAAQ